jgi:hypothetical protein
MSNLCAIIIEYIPPVGGSIFRIKSAIERKGKYRIKTVICRNYRITTVIEVENINSG